MNGISNTSGGVIGVNCSKPAPGSSSSLVKHRRRRLSDQQYFTQYGNATSLQKMTERSSAYKGITRHRWTGRFEAHLWDKEGSPAMRPKKGKQVYLGAYDDEETAARTYDLAALKYWGHSATLNFPISDYEKELKEMKQQTREEYIGSLRRKSSGFSRGVSKYRGVARHHKNGRWEARMGRVYGNKYLYLGTYATQEEAATAYDLAAIQFRGLNAITNFDRSRYCAPLNNNNFTNHIPLPTGGASEEEEIMKNSTDAIDQTAATAGNYQCRYYGTTSFEVDHHHHLHHNGLVSQSMGWVESEVQRDENRLGCAQGLDVDWDFDEEFFMEISSILRDFEDLDDADIN